MTIRQHLIDPEICIRCNTCETRCPTGAISHDRNYVVNVDICNFCMRCVRPCPTGAIDNWFDVETPFTLDEQHGWQFLPPRPAVADVAPPDAFDDEAADLLARAAGAMGGAARAPASAAHPQVNVYTRADPAHATVTGNARITESGTDSDVHHIILDFGSEYFPYLEGQSIGVLPPGTDAEGRPHAMRLYSVASPRDGEKPNTNNMSLTVKRVMRSDGQPGLASNWLCDMAVGDRLDVIGPFGSTYLMPDDPTTDLLMICTGTGVSPFRAFSLRRRRTAPEPGRMYLFFGARTPEELPYFGPLQRLLQSQLHRELVYSRQPAAEREYVQDRLLQRHDLIADALRNPKTYIYVCGLRGLEEGVETAMAEICARHALDWPELRLQMCEEGRLHIETY